MLAPGHYGHMADIVAAIHFLYIMFVVIGQIVIIMGLFFNLAFVKSVIFRSTHLVAILIVAIQRIAGVRCPLTILENHLNTLAGRTVNPDITFLARLLRELTYYRFPSWTFTFMYVGFGVFVLLTFVLFPPKLRKLQLIRRARSLNEALLPEKFRAIDSITNERENEIRQ